MRAISSAKSGTRSARAQLAATVGRQFDRELLRQMAGMDDAALAAALQMLQEARLIHATGESDSTFQFRHALIQEAAYHSQTKADRQTAHRRVAQELSSRFPHRASLEPEQVARHYTAAGLAADALPWWLAAGRGALRALAHAEAADHLRAGLALIEQLPAGGERDARELELLLPLGHALLRLRGYGSAEAIAIYERALTLCVEADPLLRFDALWGSWMVSSSRPDFSFAESARLARQLLTAAQATAHPVLLSYAHSAAANVALWQGQLEEACRHAETAIAASTEAERRAERLDGHDPCVASLAYLSWARFAQGRIADAVNACDEAVAVARRLEQPDTLGFALVHAATLRRYLRDVPEVMQLAQEALALAGHYSLPLWQGGGTTMLGWAQAIGGDARGIELLQASAAAVRQIMPGILVAFLHPLAEAYGFLGDSAAQLQVVEEALEASARLHENFHLADLHRLRGEALAGLGRYAEACDALNQALRLGARQNAASFHLRAAVTLARLRKESGDPAGASALLRDALAGRHEEALPDLAAARAAAAAGSSEH